MSFTKKAMVCAVSLAITATAGLALAQSGKTITTVVKITGETWFNRMEDGVKAFGASTPGYVTNQFGPPKADAALQGKIIEDLIAKKVNAITVVPMDPSALEGVLKRAMDRGIKVVTHEADIAAYAQRTVHFLDGRVASDTMRREAA